MKATLTDHAVKSRRLIGPSLAWLLLCQISSPVSAQTIIRPPADVPQSLTGVPHIHDGDTVEIRGVKVRLAGIDAPEMDQRCLDAKSKLSECGRKSARAYQESCRAAVDMQRFGQGSLWSVTCFMPCRLAKTSRAGWSALGWPYPSSDILTNMMQRRQPPSKLVPVYGAVLSSRRGLGAPGYVD